MHSTLRIELVGLGSNLLNGLRLLVFRPASARFHYSLHQVVLLLLVSVLVGVVLDYYSNLPDPQFNPSAFAGEALSLAGILFVAYLLAVSRRDKSAALRFIVQVQSAAPFVYSVVVLTEHLESPSQAMAWAIYGVTMIWFLAIAGYVLHTVSGRRIVRTGVYLGGYIAAVLLPPFFIWTGDYWYSRPAQSVSGAHTKLNQERVYYAQPVLVEAATRGLLRGRPGVTDLYFVGFGGYGSEDVFMKEVRFAQDVFDRNFGTQGRSVALINNAATVDDVPLATVSNLKQVLKHIGRIMNRDDDVLFLFMTSHGSEKHELTVSLRSFRLNDITPAELKGALDEAQIKWRVLMISACYSGGFIEPLKDEHTLIATASAPDKQSFGCGSESEFTYFGKAVLDEQLKAERHLPTAFQKASESIKAREMAEGKDHSEPGLFVGSAIAPKLRDLEQRLMVNVSRSD